MTIDELRQDIAAERKAAFTARLLALDELQKPNGDSVLAAQYLKQARGHEQHLADLERALGKLIRGE